MKRSKQIAATVDRKQKKRTVTKSAATANIAQRYLELLQLRARVSEVELWRSMR